MRSEPSACGFYLHNSVRISSHRARTYLTVFIYCAILYTNVHRQISGSYSEASMSNDIPFHEMTTDQAKAAVKDIIRGANSDAEIRERLNQRGFNGKAAAISSISHGSMYMAMVMVWGPKGEVISG